MKRYSFGVNEFRIPDIENVYIFQLTSQIFLQPNMPWNSYRVTMEDGKVTNLEYGHETPPYMLFPRLRTIT